MIAPIGENEGIKFFDHLIVYVTDIIWSHMIGHCFRYGCGKFIGVAGNCGENDWNCVCKVRPLFPRTHGRFTQRPACSERLCGRRVRTKTCPLPDGFGKTSDTTEHVGESIGIVRTNTENGHPSAGQFLQSFDIYRPKHLLAGR